MSLVGRSARFLLPIYYSGVLALLDVAGAMAQPDNRGLSWTRSNPMYVSSLVVSVNDPTADWMDAYFDEFNASTLLLWRGSVDRELLDWLAHDPSTSYVAWVETDGTISRRSNTVASCMTNPGCVGFQIGDEPNGRRELGAMAAGIDAIHALDPNALAIVNVLGREPLFRHSRAAAIADVLSTTNYYGEDVFSWRVRSRARDAALAYGVPYWTYLDNGGDPGDLAWRAMSSLAVGYTGISWFIYQVPASGDNHHLARDYVNFFEETGAFDSPTTENFAAAAEVNAWLSVLGRAFTQLTSTEVLYATGEHSRDVGFAEWQPSLIPLLVGVDRIDGGDWLISTFSDDDNNKYYTVLNARHPGGDTPATAGFGSDRVTLEFDLPPGTTIRILNQFDGSIIERQLDEHSSVTFDIPTGQLLLFTFEGHAFAGVEVDLDCATNPAVCWNPVSAMVDTAAIVDGFMRARASRISETGAPAGYFRSRLADAGDGEVLPTLDAAMTGDDGRIAVWANSSFEGYGRGSFWMPVGGSVATLQTGADTRIGDRFVVGAMLEVDMAQEASVFGDEIEATGWMAGPYAAARIGNLAIDVALLGGRAHGTVQPDGAPADAFTSSRWLAMARVSTEFELGPFRIAPEISVAQFNETQHEYVDANGVTIPEHSITHRQIAFGGDISMAIETERGLAIEPGIAARGVADLVWNDLSIELEAGLRLSGPGGRALSLEVAYGGLLQPGQSDFRISGSLSIALR